MIRKVVKMYSNRMRIDLNKKDGLNANEDVIIMPVEEYEKLKQELFNREDKIIALTKENEIIQQRNDSIMESIQTSKQDNKKEFEEMLEITLKPINETHKEQLEDKDNQINQLTDKLNAMQSAFHQFNIGINQLSALDILFRKKHHQVINDFNESIWIIGKEDNIINADNVPAIQEADKQEQ